MADLIRLALDAGFSHAAELNMDALTARPEVREMCSADRCRQYGRTWSCPPGCGTLEENAAEMAKYSRGVLVQTTGDMEDEFDMDAIRETGKRHKDAFETLVRQARQLRPGCLPLTAGGCTRCRTCTYPDRPCRFPGRRLSSMEAYGLLVSDVCLRSGLKYNYGRNTITYSSCILYNEMEET